jgi:histidine ammonia-lyase
MASKKILIGNRFFSYDLIEQTMQRGNTVGLSSGAKNKITRCRKFLEDRLKHDSIPVYGVNTGFGALHHIKISHSEIGTLQENLMRSHACGTGDEVLPEIVRLMLLIKINSLALGYSGVRLSVVERLIYFFNNGIVPVVYETGSLGASGDLAPLAHLCLPLIGDGEVYYRGRKISAIQLHRKLKLAPLKLAAKEGLALLNGTQYMNACGIHIALRSMQLIEKANIVASLSLDAFDCHTSPFDRNLNEVRRFPSQAEIADDISTIRKGSKIAKQKKHHVQDPYSFRCIPQVHGASLDVIQYASWIMINEANAVTDNPIVFPKEKKIISGGNFHGQNLAYALDFAAIAVSEIGSISERRIFQLLSGKRDLPPFLIQDAGVNSGFMIPQYTAAALASLNKQFCSPASVDSIVSSNGQEDHVSMGANAALKALKVLLNVEKIISIELFTAAQAIEFRKPVKSSPVIEGLLSAFRKKVPFIRKDKLMQKEMEKAFDFLHPVS